MSEPPSRVEKPAPGSAILLAHCPDQKGLVAAITEFIFRNGGNILSLEQHVDREIGRFFIRAEWELGGFLIERERIGEGFKTLIANRTGMSWRIYFSGERQRVAVLVSKAPHCLLDILARVRSGEWSVDLRLVLSNHPELAWVAEAFGAPFHHLPAGSRSPEDLEAGQLELLRGAEIDLVILARYMLILGPGFVSAFPERIINIHHSFLPAFTGARPYHRAYARGVKLIGATAHYVTEELDEGPIIEQDVVRASHVNTVGDLTRMGHDVEKIVLARGISRHLDRKTLVYGNRTIVFT
jgi:formyltetrahydrofolate deformylase